MTWHQWQRRSRSRRSSGLSSARARANASSPQGYQSTGLSACWSRYGDVSEARRFGISDTVLLMSQSRETVTANPGPPAAGPYLHAVKSNGHLFVSGQVHLDPDTGKLDRRHPGREGQALPRQPDDHRRGRGREALQRRARRRVRHRHQRLRRDERGRTRPTSPPTRPRGPRSALPPCPWAPRSRWTRSSRCERHRARRQSRTRGG